MPARKRKNRRPKNQKKRRPAQLAQDKIKRRLQAMKTTKNLELRSRMPGEQKMSKVILAFAEPLLDEAPDDEARRNIIEFAITAWNLCIIRQSGDEAYFQRSLRKMQTPGLGKPVPKTIMSFLEMLMERKLELYADNFSFIMDCEISFSDKDVHLTVASMKLPIPGES